jgi:hypothetical protein
MNPLQQVVSKFLDQREEYVRVLRQCVDADADYHRWQGHAEARRQLGQKLADAGVDLTAEAAPVANQTRIAEALAGHDVRYIAQDGQARWFCPCGDWETTDVMLVVHGHASHLAGLVTAAGMFRAEPTVKAEALREAALAQRQLAADARTNNGQAEHEDFADWLDDQAAALEPAVEGAHP